MVRKSDTGSLRQGSIPMTIEQLDRAMRSWRWTKIKDLFHEQDEEARTIAEYTRAVYACNGESELYRRCLEVLWYRVARKTS